MSKRDANPAVLSAFNSNGGVWAPEGGERSWADTNRFHHGDAVQVRERAFPRFAPFSLRNRSLPSCSHCMSPAMCHVGDDIDTRRCADRCTVWTAIDVL